MKKKIVLLFIISLIMVSCKSSNVKEISDLPINTTSSPENIQPNQENNLVETLKDEDNVTLLSDTLQSARTSN